MSRINYLDNFIEENYGKMKIEKKPELLVAKLNVLLTSNYQEK